MPASRSRTENWKSYLQKIQGRNGALEISVRRDPGTAAGGADLVWRVRIVEYNDDLIVIDPPAALGRTMPLEEGIQLIGAICIGQNRWMFHTRTIGKRSNGSGEPYLLIAMPDHVERCSRRHSHRIGTENLMLPRVHCWPLKDPTSVVAAETANRLQIRGVDGMPRGAEPPEAPESILLPDVGPIFEAHLVNISGGGLGLVVGRDHTLAVSQRPYLWLRFDLRPHIAYPIAVTARVAHTHLDSSQNLYAGLAFDFTHNPEHRQFVVDLLEEYARRLQADQRRTRAAAG